MPDFVARENLLRLRGFTAGLEFLKTLAQG